MTKTIDSPEEVKLKLNTERIIRKIKKYNPDYDSAEVNTLLKATENFNVSELSFYDSILMRKNDVLKAEIIALKDMDSLQSELGEGKFTVFRPFEYIVINPHNHIITTTIELPIAPWESGKVKYSKNILTDEQGNKYKTQKIDTLIGKLILCNVTLQPNERKKLFLDKSYFSFKSFDEILFKFFKDSLKPNKLQMASISNFKMQIATSNNNSTKSYNTEIEKISCVFIGNIATKFKVTYKSDYDGIKLLNGNFTFYKNIDTIDISFEIAKDISLVQEKISILINNIIIDDKAISSEYSTNYQFIVDDTIGKKLVLTSYDTDNYSIDNNSLAFHIYDTLNQEDFELGTSFLTETRFKLSSLSASNTKSKLEFEDIGILTLRR